MSVAPDSPGILATGVYLPRWRIARRTIAEAIGWARGRSRPGEGTRSFANWDEDALTLAVEASRQALISKAFEPNTFELASTSLPFADRHHAGIAREALRLPDTTGLSEATGHRRAATSALARALRGADGTHLLAASDCVDAQPGSELESVIGHGAAAVITGPGPGLASLLAARSRHEDFVDQYRAADRDSDYRLEARWIRDAGTRKQLSRLVGEALDEAGVTVDQVDHFLAPFDASTLKALHRDLGLQCAPENSLEAQYGRCGAAQPLMLLHGALGLVRAGQVMVLVGAGQGFDVLVLRAECDGQASPPGPAQEEALYTRFLGLRGQLDIDGGLRAERDNRSSLSATHRRHAELNGFLAGRCPACERLQFPRNAVCVHCGERGEQSLESLADAPGEVNSFTEDWLAYSPRPPLVFGNVHFPGGANVMMEFTDVEPGELTAGDAVNMAFRIKDLDTKRGYRRYFWKPVPAGGAADG